MTIEFDPNNPNGPSPFESDATGKPKPVADGGNKSEMNGEAVGSEHDDGSAFDFSQLVKPEFRDAFIEDRRKREEARRQRREQNNNNNRMVIEWFDDAANSALAEPNNPLIEDLFDENGLSVVYGDSGSGKTFVVLDLVFHVSVGLTWNSKKTRRGLIVYVAAEGGKRIKRRVAALKKRYVKEHGEDAPKPLFALIRYPIDLRSNDADLNQLLALVRAAEHETGEECVWIVVDTLSRAMAGGDENSPVDMGRVVASAYRFRRETGAHFTYVHHTGKDAARGARGHSLLRAATDTEIEVTADHVTLTKQRDGEMGFTIGFKLVDLHIGEDSNGARVKSAVVEWMAEAAKQESKKMRPPPPTARLLMEMVDLAIMETGEMIPSLEGELVHAASEHDIRERFDARMADPPHPGDTPRKAADRKRKNFERSLATMLHRKGLMAREWNSERYVWSSKPSDTSAF
jgi:AAA domain